VPNECPAVDCSWRPDQPHKMPSCRVVALFWVRPNHHEQRNGEQKGWEAGMHSWLNVFQHHADVHITNNKSETALDLAAQYGRVDTVATLLSVISPSSLVHSTAKLPLHLAASNGHLSVVAKLLEAGCDINRTVRWFGLFSILFCWSGTPPGGGALRLFADCLQWACDGANV